MKSVSQRAETWQGRVLNFLQHSIVWLKLSHKVEIISTWKYKKRGFVVSLAVFGHPEMRRIQTLNKGFYSWIAPENVESGKRIWKICPLRDCIEAQ